MPDRFMPTDHYRTKFYQKENSSKGFLDLSEERLSELAKKVYKNQEAMTENLSHRSVTTFELEKYFKALQYLTNPLIHLELHTFDEKVAYLIMMMDPNLVLYKEFLKLDLVSIEEITQVEDKYEKIRLKNIRNQTVATYESLCREKIGFYDAKLLKYEELFFKRFFNERELVTEVRNHNQNSFITKAKKLRDFNSISDERYSELVNIAQTWLSVVSETCNSNVAIYSVTNQSKLFGLSNFTEQITLFILLVDSNLDMLKIYEEESTTSNIERRIVEQFGYYNKDLVNLEKKFYDRFCPNKEISIWTKTKKD